MIRWRELANDWQARLLAANNGHEIAPGVTLHFASEEIGGFPFNLDAIFDKNVISVQSTRGSFSLASEHFAIHALTYGRDQQVMEAAGLQTLTWTDAVGGTHRFDFVPGSLHASAIENDGRLVRFDLDLTALQSSSLIAGRAQFHLRAAPDRNALDFVIRADDIRTPLARAAVLPLLTIAGRMIPAAPLSPLLSGHDAWRHALGDWRSKDGVMRLDDVDIEWGASHLTASGALAIDAANRLSGKVKMQLSDAQQWEPTRLVEIPFTAALQETARVAPQEAQSPLPLTLDIHNGATIVFARGVSRSAGSIDSLF